MQPILAEIVAHLSLTSHFYQKWPFSQTSSLFYKLNFYLKEHVKTLFINLCFVGKLTYNCFSSLISDKWNFLCQDQLPYNFSDKPHVTLCPTRLKKVRPIQIIVTFHHCWSNNARSVIVIFCTNLKRYDTTFFGPFYLIAHFSWLQISHARVRFKFLFLIVLFTYCMNRFLGQIYSSIQLL